MTAAFEPIHMLQKMPFHEIMRLSLLGNHERMSATRAYEIGLVSEVVPAEGLHDAAAWAANAIAQRAAPRRAGHGPRPSGLASSTAADRPSTSATPSSPWAPTRIRSAKARSSSRRGNASNGGCASPRRTHHSQGGTPWLGTSRPIPSSRPSSTGSTRSSARRSSRSTSSGPDRRTTTPTDTLRKVIDPLKQQVRDEGLWACHLGPELGGQGYGQVKLALLNEILGRSQWAPIVFGCQAPDTGNAEIIAHYGTDEQKAKYLQPLLDGELFSSYSMTEPQGGSDPTLFTTRAETRRRRVGHQRLEVLLVERAARRRS